MSIDCANPSEALDASVLSAFRARLVQHAAEAHLFEGLLSGLQAGGLLKTDGKQRTEAPPILANGRALNRLEFVGETLRAGLHALATVAPAWLKTVVAAAWFERYSRPAAPTGCLAAGSRAAGLGQTDGAGWHHFVDCRLCTDDPG